MIGFYLHAVLVNNGKAVEFKVGVGSPGHYDMRGGVVFQRDEWEAFRVLVVAGMRAAGFARIPIEFQDQTRLKPVEVKKKHSQTVH